MFVGCLTSRQHASVSQGRICEDKFTCCHTETEVADPTFYLTQSQYTDTGGRSGQTPMTVAAWTLTQSLDEKLDGAYRKMLRVAKNVTWRQRKVLYAGLTRISTTSRERRLRFRGLHSSDLVLWEPKRDKRSVGGQAHTSVDLLEADTGVQFAGSDG